MEQELANLRKEILSLRAEVNVLKRNVKGSKIEKEDNEIEDVNSPQFWTRIVQAFENFDTDWIKILIKEKKLTMFDTDPTYNRTILITAAYHGFYDIVELCISYGAHVDHKDRDGLTALDYARDRGWYRTEQVLLYNQKHMNANLISKIRDTAKVMNKQRGFVQNVLRELPHIGHEAGKIFKKTAMELMMTMIIKRLNFSDSFLSLCWQIAADNNNNDPLESDLWAHISSTCQEIISKGSKRDWFWLKTCIIPSTIWNQRVGNIDDYYDEEKVEEMKDAYMNPTDDEIYTKITDDKSYLYYKLLKLVKQASQSGMAKLENNLTRIINQNKIEWDKLCTWHVDDRFLIVRNDSVPNSLKAKYSFTELTRYSEGTFNASRFYDLNGFLSEMILLAQSVDNEFQDAVQNIFNINKAKNMGMLRNDNATEEKTDRSKANGIVIYKRGPVKLIEDARAKAMSDYFDRKFPTSGCILDLNRCQLIFMDVGTMLMGLDMLRAKIENGRSGCIMQIVRDKNGFRTLRRRELQQEMVEEKNNVIIQNSNKSNARGTSYAEIKVNVLIKGKERNIVGEIVFLLRAMLEFKAAANNYHSIQSKQKYMKNTVSTVLPILLDENRQLLTAANTGNVTGFLQLMVLNNKTEKDLVRIVTSKTTAGIRKRNIFHSICLSGHYRAYVFLKHTLNTERFIVNLFVPNEKNRNPIEYSVAFSNLKIIDDVFRQTGVLKRYSENDDDLFRIILWAFAWGRNEDVTNKVFTKLKINNQQMIKYVDNYKYPDPITNVYKGPLAKQYHKMKLLQQVIQKNTLEKLKKMVQMIGEDIFIKNVFITNGYDNNAIEVAIIYNKIEMLTYMFEMDEILQRCCDDNDMLYRVVVSLNENYNYQITQFVFAKLPQINNEDKLRELNVNDDIIATIMQ